MNRRRKEVVTAGKKSCRAKIRNAQDPVPLSAKSGIPKSRRIHVLAPHEPVLYVQETRVSTGIYALYGDLVASSRRWVAASR